MIGRKLKNGVVSGIGSVTESELEGSEGFVFLLTTLLLQSPMILCILVINQNRKQKWKNQPITELIPSP